MKHKPYSGFFLLIIIIWTLTRLLLCYASIFFIDNIEILGHLDRLTWLYPIAWLDVIFGLLSLIFGYLCLFRFKAFMVFFNISIIIAIISQGYLTFAHYYVHFSLDINNISQAIGKTVIILLNIYVIYLLNTKTVK